LIKRETRDLRDKAVDYGIELSEERLNLFQIYLDELWDWNQRINLTGVRTRERMVFELFLDSLIPAPFVPERGRMLDVGSGAGFPGLPLKIYRPQMEAHLLEASSKKVSFLRHLIRLLRLEQTEVLKGRIERDGDILHPEGYDLITARALAPLGRTIGWCAPFLSSGGLLVGFSGERVEADLGKSAQVMEKRSLVVHQLIPYLLPGKGSKRYAIIFKRRAR
jgi:16S rRNA (guanine527-N7)-methyltransferase